MSIRLNNYAEIGKLAKDYLSNTVSADKDCSVRFRCLVEAVINVAKYVHHNLQASYAHAMRKSTSGPSSLKWQVLEKTEHTYAEACAKKSKLYFSAASNPKDELPNLIKAIPQDVLKGIAGFGTKVLHLLDKEGE